MPIQAVARGYVGIGVCWNRRENYHMDYHTRIQFIFARWVQVFAPFWRTDAAAFEPRFHTRIAIESGAGQVFLGSVVVEYAKTGLN